MPRTISYLFQIFLDNENGKAIKDLYLLIDTLTLLYKSELDQLSAQQQKVIDAIARKWDAISVKEIAKKTRLESKNISSILSYLEKNQLVEKVTTSKKNHLYRIKERFMNIWYLMRFGRKHDKDNVIWLVRFFDAWCDESELTNRLRKHLSDLKDGKYDEAAAIDMGNTFLSCKNIPEVLKDELIKATNSILPVRLLKRTRTNGEEILNQVKTLVKEGHFQEAIEMMEDVDDKNADYYLLATSIDLMMDDPIKALENAEAALQLDSQNPFVLISLGIINEFHLDRKDVAIKFYERCLEVPQPHPYAANRLGEIYKKDGDYKKAIKFHELAVEKNFKKSLLSLGNVYLKIKKLDKAEFYFREAFRLKIEGSYSKLSKVLLMLSKENEAEKILLDAVANDEKYSNINLGRFYLMKKRPNLNKAEKEFSEAVQKGDVEGYNQLARIYIRKKQIDKAINFYKEGLSSGSSESAHQLGHVYYRKGEFEKSDEMFAKAMELGEDSVVGCWVQSIYNAGRNDQKHFAKELLEKYKRTGTSISFDLLFAKVLLWNNELQQSLGIIKTRLKSFGQIESDKLEGSGDFERDLSDLVEYFLLMIAKKDYKVLKELFIESNDFDLKIMLRPIYYLLMEELKDDFPNEYLKAGKELVETIDELRKEVEDLRGILV